MLTTIEPSFLTIEQTAKYLNTTTDIVITKIEQNELPTFVAIPPTPMVFINKDNYEDMRMFFSNSEQYADKLEELAIIQAGIFKIDNDVITSVAINGNTLLYSVLIPSLEDEGYSIDSIKKIRKKHPNSFSRVSLWLIQPIEISLSNIRIQFRYVKDLYESIYSKRLVDDQIKIKESSNEQKSTEKPLHASEQNTIQDDESDSYHTQALDALHAAISQFWINYDPSRPPKSPEIVEWLMREHKMTQTMAASIDRVIRPEELRKGGNTKLS